MLMHILKVLVAMIVGECSEWFSFIVSFRFEFMREMRREFLVQSQPPQKHYRYKRTFTRGACGASVFGTVGTRARGLGRGVAHPPWRR
jgi:hypothetical protein